MCFWDGAASTATIAVAKAVNHVGAPQRRWKHIRAKAGTTQSLQRCPFLALLGCDIILRRRWKPESERQVTNAAVRRLQCQPHINNSPHQNNRAGKQSWGLTHGDSRITDYRRHISPLFVSIGH